MGTLRHLTIRFRFKRQGLDYDCSKCTITKEAKQQIVKKYHDPQREKGAIYQIQHHKAQQNEQTKVWKVNDFLYCSYLYTPYSPPSSVSFTTTFLSSSQLFAIS